MKRLVPLDVHTKATDEGVRLSITDDGVLLFDQVLSPDFAEEWGVALVGAAHAAAPLMKKAGRR